MKLNLWKLIRKARLIRELIQITIELVRYIIKETKEPKLIMMAKKIKGLLTRIFGKSVV